MQTDPVTVEVVHQIAVEKAGDGVVVIDPDLETYEHLSTVTLTAEANYGSEFSGWTGDIASAENPVTVTLDHSKAIIANFTDVNSPELSLEGEFPAFTKVPEFTLNGSASDNIGIAEIRYRVSNQKDEGTAPIVDGNFELTVPLNFGENDLTITAVDFAGLETIVTRRISWEPDHSWILEAPQRAQEAREIAVDIYLNSPGDVAGANLTLTSNPTSLSFLRFRPDDELDQSFHTTSYEDGVMSLTFASAGRTVSPGKQRLGRVFYRVRSLPNQSFELFSLAEIDLAGADGFPFEIASGIANAGILLEPRTLVGDVNNNGRYDAGDAQHLQRLLGGLAEIRPWDRLLNDANGNGSFEIGDVIVVLQTAAGVRPQPAERRAKSRDRKVAIAFHPSAPQARIVLDPPHAAAGAVVKAKIVVDHLPQSFGGAAFTLEYPVEALRLTDQNSLLLGDLQPNSSLYLWNLAPSRDNFEMQDGTISFAAGSAESWPDSIEGGTIAEFHFIVQETADSKETWQLKLTESELSFDEGLTVTKCNLEPAVFVGQVLDWSTWQLANFSLEELEDPAISATSADPDADGRTNHLEFYQGTDPRSADAGESAREIWVEAANGENYFALEVPHDPRVSGVTPILEWSHDLQSWHTNDDIPGTDWWIKISPATQSPAGAAKSLFIDLSEQSSAPKFLRLRLQSR